MCVIDDEVKSLELNDEFSDDEFDNLSYEELLMILMTFIGIMKNSFLCS